MVKAQWQYLLGNEKGTIMEVSITKLHNKPLKSNGPTKHFSSCNDRDNWPKIRLLSRKHSFK